MRITDTSGGLAQHEEIDCALVRAQGDVESGIDSVQVEGSVRVYINGELSMILTCSADYLPELVLGRLFTEGIIAGADEVDEISVCEHATRVVVVLKDRAADMTRTHVDHVPSCCTFNRNLNEYFLLDETLEPVVPIPWDEQEIFDVARSFEVDTPLHRLTGSAHSCYLVSGGEILYCCEDLGRHNAFDKVVGCALRDGVDLRQCLVYTSGRIPTDMTLKAIRSRIPILVSKAVPTNLTIEMARSFDLTLICSARSKSFRVFNDPLGVVWPDRSQIGVAPEIQL